MKINKVLDLFRMKYSNPRKRAELIKSSDIGIKIGGNCEVYSGVSFGSEPYLIDIGDNVRITKNVSFITHDGGMWVLRNTGKIDNGDLFGQIKVGNNVHIGINSVIMPNVKIGNNVIIGVGAIVTKDIPDNSIAVGIPARVIKSIDDYYEKHKYDVDLTKNLDYIKKKEYLTNKFNIKNRD